MTPNALTQFLAAGVLSGCAGLLVFLIIHHLWIRPIWFILPVGLVIASIGGLAVGWAYAELYPRLPPQPWTILAVIGLIAATLLPALILAELRAPLFRTTDGTVVLLVSRERAAAIFLGELVLTSILAGGMIGWLVRGTFQAAVAAALAGLAFALGPGHNIPLIGGTPGVGKEVAIIAAVIIVSAIALVGVQHVLAQSRGIPGIGTM